MQVVGVVLRETAADAFGRAHRLMSEREGEDMDAAAFTGDAIDAIAVESGEVVGVVRIRLQHEHRIQKRRPVGVARIELKVDEVAEREIHQQLPIQLGTQLFAIRLPCDLVQLSRGLQQIDVALPGGESSRGSACIAARVVVHGRPRPSGTGQRGAGPGAHHRGERLASGQVRSIRRLHLRIHCCILQLGSACRIASVGW